MMKPIGYILMGIGVAFALVLAFMLGQRHPVVSPVEPRVDTLFIRDTSSYVKPQSDTPRVVTKEIPIPVLVADTTMIDSLLRECARLERKGDSIQLVLLREQRHYGDSTYDAWVSGIAPSLDSIKTYNEKVVITREIPVIQVKRTRWGVGIQGGMGVGTDGILPYIGVGISYNLLSW